MECRRWNYSSYKVLERIECSILSDHRRIAPKGLKGGEPGRIGRNWITRKSGKEENLGGCGQNQVEAGDSVTIQSPTGDGFGKAKT